MASIKERMAMFEKGGAGKNTSPGKQNGKVTSAPRWGGGFQGVSSAAKGSTVMNSNTGSSRSSVSQAGTSFKGVSNVAQKFGGGGGSSTPSWVKNKSPSVETKSQATQQGSQSKPVVASSKTEPASQPKPKAAWVGGFQGVSSVSKKQENVNTTSAGVKHSSESSSSSAQPVQQAKPTSSHGAWGGFQGVAAAAQKFGGKTGGKPSWVKSHADAETAKPAPNSPPDSSPSTDTAKQPSWAKKPGPSVTNQGSYVNKGVDSASTASATTGGVGKIMDKFGGVVQKKNQAESVPPKKTMASQSIVASVSSGTATIDDDFETDPDFENTQTIRTHSPRSRSSSSASQASSVDSKTVHSPPATTSSTASQDKPSAGDHVFGRKGSVGALKNVFGAKTTQSSTPAASTPTASTPTATSNTVSQDSPSAGDHVFGRKGSVGALKNVFGAKTTQSSTPAASSPSQGISTGPKPENTVHKQPQSKPSYGGYGFAGVNKVVSPTKTTSSSSPSASWNKPSSKSMSGAPSTGSVSTPSWMKKQQEPQEPQPASPSVNEPPSSAVSSPAEKKVNKLFGGNVDFANMAVAGLRKSISGPPRKSYAIQEEEVEKPVESVRRNILGEDEQVSQQKTTEEPAKISNPTLSRVSGPAKRRVSTRFKSSPFSAAVGDEGASVPIPTPASIAEEPAPTAEKEQPAPVQTQVNTTATTTPTSSPSPTVSKSLFEDDTLVQEKRNSVKDLLKESKAKTLFGSAPTVNEASATTLVDDTSSSLFTPSSSSKTKASSLFGDNTEGEEDGGLFYPGKKKDAEKSTGSKAKSLFGATATLFSKKEVEAETDNPLFASAKVSTPVSPPKQERRSLFDASSASGQTAAVVEESRPQAREVKPSNNPLFAATKPKQTTSVFSDDDVSVFPKKEAMPHKKSSLFDDDDDLFSSPTKKSPLSSSTSNTSQKKNSLFDDEDDLNFGSGLFTSSTVKKPSGKGLFD